MVLVAQQVMQLEGQATGAGLTQEADRVTSYELGRDRHQELVDQVGFCKLAEQRRPAFAGNAAYSPHGEFRQKQSEIHPGFPYFDQLESLRCNGDVRARRVDDDRCRTVPLEQRRVSSEIEAGGGDHQFRQGALTPPATYLRCFRGHGWSPVTFLARCRRSDKDCICGTAVGNEQCMVGIRAERCRCPATRVGTVHAHHHVSGNPRSTVGGVRHPGGEHFRECIESTQ